MDFVEWKRQAVEYLRELERTAKVEEGAWDWLLGGDDDMRTGGHEDEEFFDNPRGYVGYQIECAQ